VLLNAQVIAVAVPRLLFGAGQREHDATVRQRAVCTEQALHQRQPRGRIPQEVKLRRVELGQCHVVPANVACLQLREASLLQILYQIKPLQAVHCLDGTSRPVPQRSSYKQLLGLNFGANTTQITTE